MPSDDYIYKKINTQIEVSYFPRCLILEKLHFFLSAELCNTLQTLTL